MKQFLLSLIAFAIALTLQAEGVTFGYTHDENLVPWGTAKQETYNIAIRIDDAGLAGSRLTAISLPLNPEAVNLKDCKVFVTRNLKLTSGSAVPDVLSVDFTPAAEGLTTVTLPEAFVLDGEPFYAGVSVTVSKLETEGDSKPFLVKLGGTRNGFFLGTSRSYRKWEDWTVGLSRTSPLSLQLEGDFTRANQAGIVLLTDQQVKRGKVSDVKAVVINHGQEEISSIDYTYTNDGGTVSGTVQLEKPIAGYFGAMRTVSFPTPALSELSTSSGQLTLTGVNGTTNEDLAASAVHQVEAVRVVLVKRPLLEEFTGTWCGWCPRGYVGLLLLNERHPDEFIGASFHYGDAMTVTENYAVDFNGEFPSAFLDRSHRTDAYRGDSMRDMGIELTWLEACEKPTTANVYVNAIFNASETKINVEAEYEFGEDQTGIDYGVTYLVTADGLTGTGSAWVQHSYFPGVKDYGPEMDMFTKGSEYIYLTYDDVVIGLSNKGNSYINGVIPSTVHTEDIVKHSYTFDANSMTSMYTHELLVQDKSKLNVIAILYDKTEKTIVNCAKVRVKRYDAEGIETITAETAPVVVGRYNLDGTRQTHALAGSLVIERLSDGTSRKVLNR